MSENIMYKNIADKMKQANEEIEELKADNQELQDSITWWNNRYNALQRDYEDYKSRCEKAIELLQNDINFGDLCDGYKILNILNGKE